NYTNNSLTVTASAAPALEVPSFSRGAGQAVNLPASGTTGIPVTISNATNVQSAGFVLTYDPALLTIAPTGALTLAPAAGATGLTLAYSITAVDANHARLTASITGGNGWSPAHGAGPPNIPPPGPRSAPPPNQAGLRPGRV